MKTETEEETQARTIMNVAICLSLAALVLMFVNVALGGKPLGGLLLGGASLLGGGLALYKWSAIKQIHEAEPNRGPFRVDERAVSPVIAVILMVAITVVLAATVFVLVADIGANPPPPSISFQVDSVADTLTVASVSSNTLTWGELAVDGCTKPGNDTTVDAGDELTGCSGDVKVIHRASNSMIYSARFD